MKFVLVGLFCGPLLTLIPPLTCTQAKNHGSGNCVRDFCVSGDPLYIVRILLSMIFSRSKNRTKRGAPVPWIVFFSANTWCLDVLTFLIKGFAQDFIIFLNPLWTASWKYFTKLLYENTKAKAQLYIRFYWPTESDLTLNSLTASSQDMQPLCVRLGDTRFWIDSKTLEIFSGGLVWLKVNSGISENMFHFVLLVIILKNSITWQWTQFGLTPIDIGVILIGVRIFCFCCVIWQRSESKSYSDFIERCQRASTKSQ